MSWIEKVAPVLLRRSQQMRFPIRAFCDKISSESATTNAPINDAPDSQVLAEDADNTTFKCKEYFEHNPMTFYDVEKEMEKYRAPQPVVHN